MKRHEFISDHLEVLGVKHTCRFSQREFDQMSFKSLFGLKCLLKSYGIDSYGVKIDDKNSVTDLPLPFVATVNNGDWVIVTSLSKNTVTYLTQGVSETIKFETFLGAWTGVAYIANPTSVSCEPGYRSHWINELMAKFRNLSIVVLLLVLLFYCIIQNGFLGYLLAGSWRMLPDNLFESATLYVLPIRYN